MQSCSLIALFSFTVIVLLILGVRLADGLTLWKISIPRMKWTEHSKRLDAVFLLSGIAFIWIARLPILQFDLALNPDEAQFSANAMRIWAGGMNWDNLDSLSSGPLNSAVLAWPCLMGLDVTLTTTRMMGTAIISIMLLLFFLGVRRFLNTEIAVLISFPLFVFYASTSTHDFIQYSSECLPMLLISAGIYGYLRIAGNRPSEKGHLSIFLLSAFSLGLVPFAKLQAVPLAFLVGLGLIAIIIFLPCERKQKWKRLSWVSCAALAPSMMFLLPLLFRGELHHFVNSYILFAKNYVGNPLNIEEFFRLVTINVFFRDIFFSYVAVFAISLGLCCFFPDTIDTPKKWAGGLAVLAIPAAWYSIARPGMGFMHYLQLMLPPLALSAGVLYAIGSDAILVRMQSVRLQGGMHILLCLAVIGAVVPAGILEIDNNLAYQFGDYREGLMFKSPRLMQWLGTKKSDSILIWGWMPQWYLSTGLTPATRESEIENCLGEVQVQNLQLRNYYRERLIEDFNKSRPDFILDAVAPDSYRLIDPDKDSISAFPALSQIINNSFIKVSGNDPQCRCPRLYVRKERFAEIQRNLVPIYRISASGQYNEAFGPEHVNDGNVFEFSNLSSEYHGACAGYWLLPEALTGYITLEFANSQVGSVSILNTRDYVATDKVRILIFQGETVLHQHELILKRYPYWTNYKLPEPVAIADHVRIEILSYIGKGAGVNEIKIYREQPEGME